MRDKPIPLMPVESSNIEAVGYDQEEQELIIEFKSGRTYIYFDVPFDVYTGLMDAESKGKYFHKNIRNIYEYQEL